MAEELFRRAWALLDEDVWNRWRWHIPLLRARGELALAEGRHEEAWSYAVQSLEMAAQTDSRKHVARDALLEARVDVERAIAEARAGREKEARRALEQEIAALANANAEVTEVTEAGRRGGDAGDAPPDSVAATDLRPGIKVRIRSLGLEGEVESIQGDDVAVRVRGRRVRVRARDLS